MKKSICNLSVRINEKITTFVTENCVATIAQSVEQRIRNA